MRNMKSIFSMGLFFLGTLLTKGQTALIPVNKIEIPGVLRDYSGITWVEGDSFLLVNDKQPGFYLMEIKTDQDGSIKKAEVGLFVSIPAFIGCDVEGITYNPKTKTVFVSEETTQRIEGFGLFGHPKARIQVPAMFMAANGSNRGFESLTYSSVTGKYWTTTEDGLPQDGGLPAYGKDSFIRLQEFNSGFSPERQFGYRIDPPRTYTGSALIYGVSDLLALPDGRLLVMEREANTDWLSSYMDTRIYLVDPGHGLNVKGFNNLSEIYRANQNIVLKKTLLWSCSTGVMDPTNYEGMCLGKKMPNGDYQVFIISDAGGGAYNQKQYVQSFILKGVNDTPPPSPHYLFVD